MANEKKSIKIEQIKSPIGYPRKQREVLRTLGLRRIRHVVERQDLPAVRGAVAKIPHLVRIIEQTPASEDSPSVKGSPSVEESS